MRVLFCKIHCSLICFCKPSSHLYTPSPLKLENTPHASPPQPPPPPESNNSLEERQAFETQSTSKDDETCNDKFSHPSENGLKSSMRKISAESSPVEKKKVQWVDLLGKQLVEIKEFEPSDGGDTDYQRTNNRRCICSIL